MNPKDHADTRKLISDIESKDRKFRVAWVLFMMCTLLVLIGVIAVQLRTLNGVQEQLRQQKVLLEAQKSSTEDIKQTTANVSKQLDCIAQFFATRERATAVITDLEQCRIVRPDGSIINLTPAPAPQPGQATPSQSTQQSESKPETNSEETPSNPQQPTVDVPTIPTPEKPPVEILGIPVCVPFTGICVR